MPKRNFDSEQQQSVIAPSAKIARRLLIKIVASSLLIMTAISAVTFFVTYNQAHDQIVRQLKEEQSSALAHPIAFLNRIERWRHWFPSPGSISLATPEYWHRTTDGVERLLRPNVARE